MIPRERISGQNHTFFLHGLRGSATDFGAGQVFSSVSAQLLNILHAFCLSPSRQGHTEAKQLRIWL